MRCATSLGHGMLWFLFEEHPRYNFLFTRGPVTLEQWPAWARQPVVWRTRQLGEKHEPSVRENIIEAARVLYEHGLRERFTVVNASRAP